MCGILGACPGTALDLTPLSHRGPDGRGVVHAPDVSFGHTRLAILELTQRAAQPIRSQDGSVLLTYNGEIYNYRSLGVGEEHSDTVALAEWLARRGPDFNPAELDGMYAFAAYFVNERRLVLCRDPVGIKPLFIALNDDGTKLAFASEIKGFFGIDGFDPQPNLDPAVQREFMQYGAGLPRPAQLSFRGRALVITVAPTLIRGVYHVAPGQTVDLPMDGQPRSRSTVLPRLDRQPLDALTESVREQSMSDVEVGVQLSGGVDSSLVAHYYATNNPAVHGFFVSVDYKGLSEDPWARMAAEVLSKVSKFQFHRIVATEAEVRRVLPHVVWHLDEAPIRHPNAIGVYLLCEYVRRQTRVKVLLTGEGADELFGGYSWHDGKRLTDFERSRRLFDTGGSPLVNDILAATAGATRLESQLLFDRVFYLPPILARQDRMSMAHSIEARVPFLSNRFLQMPSPAKPGKQILKAEAARIFGRKFAKRTKCGFGFPLPWLAAVDAPSRTPGWMQEPWTPQTDFQRWSLASLGLWSQMYLEQGWKGILGEKSAVPPPLNPAPR